MCGLLLLTVSFTCRLKPNTHYYFLSSVLSRSFLSGVLDYAVLPCVVTLGSTCSAPWALLVFFKIVHNYQLKASQIFSDVCAFDLPSSRLLLALVKEVPSTQTPAWDGFHPHLLLPAPAQALRCLSSIPVSLETW